VYINSTMQFRIISYCIISYNIIILIS